MQQLNLRDRQNNELIENEIAADLLFIAYGEHLLQLEDHFPEFGAEHNNLEWTKFKDDHLAVFQREHYECLEHIAEWHDLPLQYLRNLCIDGQAISIFQLRTSYNNYILQHGYFPHTAAPHVWRQLAEYIGFHANDEQAWAKAFVLYDRFIRPAYQDKHEDEFEAIRSSMYEFDDLFSFVVAGLQPNGPLAFGEEDVNPCRLYSAVQDRGGYARISSSSKQWEDIAWYLGCDWQVANNGQRAAVALRDVYEKLFLDDGDSDEADDDLTRADDGNIDYDYFAGNGTHNAQYILQGSGHSFADFLSRAANGSTSLEHDGETMDYGYEQPAMAEQDAAHQALAEGSSQGRCVHEEYGETADENADQDDFSDISATPVQHSARPSAAGGPPSGTKRKRQEEDNDDEVELERNQLSAFEAGSQEDLPDYQSDAEDTHRAKRSKTSISPGEMIFSDASSAGLSSPSRPSSNIASSKSRTAARNVAAANFERPSEYFAASPTAIAATEPVSASASAVGASWSAGQEESSTFAEE
jgi:hypothetical protein